MSILSSVRRYLLTCPLLAGGRLCVDYLGPKPRQYSIEEIPCEPVLRRYFDGGERRQFLFLLASRERHGADSAAALAGHGCYEQFEAWLKEQNRRRILPQLAPPREALRLETTTGGYILTGGTDSARYEIHCKLTYYEKGMR